MEQYTTLDSFNKMRMNIEKDIDIFKNRFKRSAEKTDLEKLFDKCKAYI